MWLTVVTVEALTVVVLGVVVLVVVYTRNVRAKGRPIDESFRPDLGRRDASDAETRMG
jgi:hypothetical protein